MEALSDCQSIGNLLRQRREEKQLSIEVVSNALRLSQALIQNLEANLFENIHYVYLKGYLAAYAKLLDLTGYEDMVQALCLPSQSSLCDWSLFHAQRQVTAGHKFMQWITYGIIISLLMLVILWWKSDSLNNSNLAMLDDTPGQHFF